MRIASLAAVLALVAAPAFAPAFAQTPEAPATSQTDSTTTTTTTHSSKHESMDDRFKKANTTNDGHLTKQQAEAAGDMKMVVKHFDEIDADHNGYVTTDEIHAYHKARKAAHKAAKQEKSAE